MGAHSDERVVGVAKAIGDVVLEIAVIAKNLNHEPAQARLAVASVLQRRVILQVRVAVEGVQDREKALDRAREDVIIGQHGAASRRLSRRRRVGSGIRDREGLGDGDGRLLGLLAASLSLGN
jgi:hypothetical protein